MKGIVFLGFIFACCLPCSNLFAQADSLRKSSREEVKRIDSEKNIILTSQSEELQAMKAAQINDSIRLLELKKEILQLGAASSAKKQVLTQEQSQIRVNDSLRRQLQKLKIDSIRSKMSGFPVVLEPDTILYVYSKLGSFSPKERAEAIENRLHKLADNYYFNPDSLVTVSNEFTSDVVYIDEVILSVTDVDAVWMNSNRNKLAAQYRFGIASSVKLYKFQHSWKTIFREIMLALLVLVLLIIIIYAISKLAGWIKSRIEKQRGSGIRGLKFRNYEVLDTNRQLQVINSLVNGVKWFVILVMVYLSLPILFGIFPWTGGYAAKLISYFLDPIKHILFSIWNYLPNLFTIIVLLIFFRYLLRILHYFKTEIEKGVLKIPGFYTDWANPTFQIIRVLILAFMVIVIFPYLPGSDSQIFKGVSVFLGVLFTFGSAGALGNVVAGLVLTYMRAYKIGDRVKIGDAVGDVVEKSLLVTRIKTIKNEVVSIPNSSVMGSQTTNFSAEALEHGLIIHTTVTIGYDAPWRQIHELLIKAALATELVETEPAPFVFQTSLDDFYVSYQINAYTRSPNQQHITYSRLHQHIQDIFNEAGVEIMSSHYSNLRDGNQTTVPASHLPEDYKAPGFRVNKDG